ncbi:MAG: hypothetical protein B7X10_01155 [Burkholderiales bacterium 21-58-4]|nr:MAG: hypothetical protein B7X10_01155 [Burkholderiales bacterium 21-58-4]
MNEAVTTFEGLKAEVEKLEGFVESMIPFHHPEPSLSPVEGERTEPVTSVSTTDEADGVPSPAPAAEPVVESAPSEPVLVEPAPSEPSPVESDPSVPVHVLETRSFGRDSVDHPMVINVTRGAS